MNIYTKCSSDASFLDLCKNVNVREEVRNFYDKYKGRCEPFLSTISNADNYVRKYYVYAWFADTLPKRYFYVGKGTGFRYNHIINDIKNYKNGKQNSRFQRYSEIQDKWGIDYEIIMKDLTEYEALIYEECKKLEFLDNGEVLLNVEGIPDEYLVCDWCLSEQDEDIPALVKDPYYQRYFDNFDTPHFDKVCHEDLMRTYIYPYFVDSLDPEIIRDKEFIINWLQSQNAKLYKTVSKKTSSVIVQGILKFDRYLDYRNNGKKIFSSKEVIELIKSSSI